MAFAASALDDYRERLKKKAALKDRRLTGDGQDAKIKQDDQAKPQ